MECQFPDEDDLSEGLYMIHPTFLDQNAIPLPRDQPLSGTLSARMVIIAREMVGYHRQRISVGTRFNCHEGSRIVGTGAVTKFLALTA